MAKNNNGKVVSPVGVSQYAWLTTPDTRFDETGHYKTNLILKAKDAQPLVTQINAEIKKSLTLAKEKAKGKSIKQAPSPFEDELIDGKPSGNVIFKLLLPDKIIGRDDKECGQIGVIVNNDNQGLLVLLLFIGVVSYVSPLIG